jgi:hypothetical protein
LEEVIAETFGKMYGLPCWNVKPGLFPGLTMEFGQPHLEVNREPQPPKADWSRRLRKHMARRVVVIHGDWHLWVLSCNWSISIQGKEVGDSSTRRRIQKGARALDGQALVAVEVRPRGCRTFFRFDLGGVLQTWPHDRKSEQWHLFTPLGRLSSAEGRHFGAVLTLRADKMYQFAQGAEERWRPVLDVLGRTRCST